MIITLNVRVLAVQHERAPRCFQYKRLASPDDADSFDVPYSPLTSGVFVSAAAAAARSEIMKYCMQHILQLVT